MTHLISRLSSEEGLLIVKIIPDFEKSPENISLPITSPGSCSSQAPAIWHPTIPLLEKEIIFSGSSKIEDIELALTGY